MKLVIDDKIPYIRQVAQQFGECIFVAGVDITPQLVHDADVLIVRTRTQVNRQLLQGSKVKLVATATIGHDHIHTTDLRELGIAWRNCPGCNAMAVAQYVRNAMYMASVAGILPASFVEGKAHGLKVGVVGCGHVGTAVAKTLSALGCEILACDPPLGKAYTLTDLAQQADVITLHTPLTYEGKHATFHLADEKFFASLQRKPLFINAARGECMKALAVERALDLGQISAAIVDTWENEPNISLSLLKKAFIATPHIAGYSAEGKSNATRMSLEHVARFFNLPCHFNITPPSLSQSFEQYGNVAITEWVDRLSSYTDCHISAQALAALRLYQPLHDSERLKENPDEFEAQRGDYPLRRECSE